MCKNHDNKVIWSVLKNRKSFVEVFIYNFGGRKYFTFLDNVIQKFWVLLGWLLGRSYYGPFKEEGVVF